MKHKFSTIAFLLLYLLIVCSCKNHSEKEVNEAVRNYFTTYKKKDFRSIDRTYLSKELSSLIDQSLEREKLEVEKIAQSDYPSDKPFIMEGDVFSSLYEGADSMKIINVQINEDIAVVDVKFINMEYKPYTIWMDQLILVKENGWKVENVIFGRKDLEIKNTKDVLLEYIYAEE